MSKKKRKVCVVTGTRAEYGLLYWLMKAIKDDPELILQVVVTGMHLSPEFGLTYKVIEEDGFTIDEKVEMLLSSDTPVGIAKSIGLGVIGFADTLDRLKPDILVVLGDRYEILAAAQAAMVAKIPIAHLHGGEVTEGVIDDPIRHSITKMAHLHFVSTEAYRKRVIQLGEAPEQVYCYGAPGLDNTCKLKLLNKEELEKKLNFQFGDQTFVVTYHPETLTESNPTLAYKQLLAALSLFQSAKIIFTKSNSDTSGRSINMAIDDFVAQNSKHCAAYTSLGQVNYLSALKHCNVVIGNSSSGIYEAPVFNTPTVNIGNRQSGRIKSASIIDCDGNKEAIVKAIKKAMSPDFIDLVTKAKPVYSSDGNVSIRIKEVIKEASLNSICRKQFFDLQ